MDPKALDKLLPSLLDRDSNVNFDLELMDPMPWEGDPSLSSREADLLLQEGKHHGLLEGERGEGDGQHVLVVKRLPYGRRAATTR
jgi:hypothetical protein